MAANRANIMSALTAPAVPAAKDGIASLASLSTFLPVAIGSAIGSGKPATPADVADVVSWVVGLVESALFDVLTAVAPYSGQTAVRPALTAADIRVKPKARGAVGVSLYAAPAAAKDGIATTGGQVSAWVNIHGDQMVATVLRSALGAAGVSTTATPDDEA